MHGRHIVPPCGDNYKMTGHKLQPAHARDANKTLEVLYEISMAVNTTRNLEELYPVIHRSLSRILNVKNFYIAIHYPEKDTISFPYLVDETEGFGEDVTNFSQTASLTGIVINSRKPHIFYKKDVEEFARQNKRIIGSVAHVWLGAPLIVRDKVIGAIAIQSYSEETDYEKQDLDLLNSVSQHVALAIERKEFDKKLSDQGQLLEKILESSPVGIAYLENRVFKWVNSEMVRMFGYDAKADFENRRADMVYNDLQASQAAGSFIFERLAKRDKTEFEHELKRKDGTVFSANILLSGFHPENRMGAVIAIITDISEQKIARRARIEKEKLQGVLEMAGAICHELNQPLQTITGYADLFTNPKDITQEDLAAIRKQASRIGDITRRLAGITMYKTRDYPGNKKIVDIWGASGNSE